MATIPGAIRTASGPHLMSRAGEGRVVQHMAGTMQRSALGTVVWRATGRKSTDGVSEID